MYRLLIPLLLLAVCACGHQNNESLNRAESLMLTDPEHALYLLDSIADSSGGDDHLSMRIHFLRGYAYVRSGQYNDALREALTVEYLLNQMPYDAYWSGRVQLLIGVIYDEQNLYSESASRFRTAAGHYRNSGYSDYSQFAQLYMAETYAYACRPDSAISYLTDILKQPDSIDDSLKYNAAKALVHAYLEGHQPDSALEVLYHIDKDEQNHQLDLLKGRVFTALGCTDSARSYINSAIQFYPQSLDYAITHYLLAKLDSIDGDFRGAYLEINKAMELNDKVVQAKESAYANSIERDYLHQQMHMEKVEAARKRFIMFAVIVVMVVVCVGLLYIMYRRRIAHRATIEQNMAEMVALINDADDALSAERDLAAQLDMTRGQVSELENRLANRMRAVPLPELFRESFRTLDAISAQYFTMQDSPMQTKQSIKEFEHELARLRGEEASAQILRTANQCFDNILDDLTKEMTTLTQTDVLLLAYQMLGFSAKSISLFLGLSLANFYKKRARLKIRIERSNFSRKDEFMIIYKSL